MKTLRKKFKWEIENTYVIIRLFVNDSNGQFYQSQKNLALIWSTINGNRNLTLETSLTKKM